MKKIILLTMMGLSVPAFSGTFVYVEKMGYNPEGSWAWDEDGKSSYIFDKITTVSNVSENFMPLGKEAPKVEVKYFNTINKKVIYEKIVSDSEHFFTKQTVISNLDDKFMLIGNKKPVMTVNYIK